MTKPKVFVIAEKHSVFLSPLASDSRIDFVLCDRFDIADELSASADAALYISGTELLRRFLKRANRLRWIHSFYTGVESIVSPEMLASGATLTNARGFFKKPLAEFVIASILFFNKGFRRLVKNQEHAIWDQFTVEETDGKTMGIVGYGATGRACAELATAFGMKVWGVRRRPELSANDPLIEKVLGSDRISEMLPLCDYVVLTAPATPASRHLIGDAELSALKPNTLLINVGRGSLIDEASLVQALDQKKIRGAALDVFEKEPLPQDHPFYRMDNVLLSPHCTDYVTGWQDRAMQLFLSNLDRFLDGEPLANVVDKHAGY